MKNVLLIMAVGACVALTGCSTAGPYVTNISSDGRGNLIVEKNTVHMNGFTGYISSGNNPTTSTLKFLPDSLLQK